MCLGFGHEFVERISNVGMRSSFWNRESTGRKAGTLRGQRARSPEAIDIGSFPLLARK